MEKIFAVLGVTLAFSSVAYAATESDHWFNSGAHLAWYQHPCGYQAFVKYGSQDTPQNRDNYYVTLKHPEMCSTLFP